MDVLKIKAAEDFWKRKLSFSSANDIIAHFARSGGESASFRNDLTIGTTLTDEVVDKISRMCSSSEALIFNFHLTAVSALLNRYTEADSLVIGSSPFRLLEDSSPGILLFYRIQVDPSASFKQLFGAVKAEVLETHNYQDIGFDDLSSMLPGGFPADFLKLGLAVSGITRETGLLGRFDILLTVDGTRLTVCFDANRHDSMLMEFFLENYRTFLENILKDPYKPLNTLEFISEKERQLLLNEFQAGEKALEYPTVVDRFEAQVKKTPGKTAVELNGYGLTYSELNSSSNKLSRYLMSLADLKKDDLVAVVMDRTERMAVSIMAVWKAGAAYVPVDPEYPEERIKAILGNSRCRLIISDSSVPSSVCGLLETFCPVVYTDKVWKDVENLPGDNTGILVDPDSLAYVIYTSGSTGRPKGVMIEHKGMMNHIEAKCIEMEIGTDSVVVQNAPQCFDISVWQLFAALMTGGKTLIYDNDTVLDILEFIRKTDREEVTTLELVPSYLFEMLYLLEEHRSEISFSKLNILILNAETLLPALVDRWFRCYPHIRIVNTYGATEVSDDMSHYIMSSVPDTSTIPVMQRPIQNFRLYILNGEKRLCPVGVKGEIFLSGFAVGRGYLNDAERTAASFMHDHLGSSGEVRMYRTGDIGRLLPDGRMEFYGRKDYQVKIRGHRVELGEIEHKLMAVPGIKNVVVTDRPSRNNTRYLAAYIIADFTVDPQELALKLKAHLPEYMIPSYFVQVGSYPLTPNGKVDKKALPDPELAADIQAGEIGEDISNETVARLIGIWKDILGRENIGTSDNFFEIGGHSLLATKLIYKIHKELQVKLELRTVFTHPTIRELYPVISGHRHSSFVEIQPLQEQEYYQLSHAQKRLWILCQFENTSLAYNMHGSYRFEGALDTVSFEKAFQALISRHESLRTIFVTAGGEPWQKIVKPGESGFRLEVIDVSDHHSPLAEAENIASREALIPFDLTKGPLLRAKLLKLGEEKYVFLFTMHHIIGDGWSMGVLVNEVMTLYGTYCRNEETPLRPLRIQYRDYAAWQNQQLQGDLLKKHQDYWKGQLSGELPVLQLPYDRPRPKVQSFSGGMHNFNIDTETAARLKAFSRERDVTLFVSLLAVSKVLLYRYSGQTDIIVGSPVAGREHSDLEDQIGFYVNTLALRTEFSPSDSFDTLLGIIRENTINAYEHQIYPFDRLVDDLSLQRDLSRSAVFDVMVALQNTTLDNRKPPALDGIRISHYPNERKVSMFDLTFNFIEHGDGIITSIEYNTDLFVKDTILALSRHFGNLLNGLMDDPSCPLSEIPLMDKEEIDRILAFNPPPVPFGSSKTLAGLFEEQVSKTPENVAIVSGGVKMTYSELNTRANRLSVYLSGLGIGRGSYTGLMLDRSHDMVIAVLAILKAGGAYVPFEPSFPRARIENVVADLGISCMLTHEAYRRTVEDMLYSQECLRDIIYLDTKNEKPAVSKQDKRSVEALWDHIAGSATDRITAGGFLSAYSGEPFPAEEVEEYVSYVKALADPYLGRDKTVLEIGAGSGLIMFELCNEAGTYIALDPSPLTQEKNRAEIGKRGISNVELITGYADELEEKVKVPVDLIIVASTVQFFPDLGYLEMIVDQGLKLLRPGGKIIFADVPDPAKRKAFIESLEEYTRNNPDKKEKTKRDTSQELYVAQQWWEDYVAGKKNISTVFKYRSKGFENELKYRYDIVLTKESILRNEERIRLKNQWTLYHLPVGTPPDPRNDLSSEDIAYVIYTSGSTGAPKGVYVKHKPVINLIEWVNRTYNVTEKDRLLFITSLCFDLSVYDIFGMLSSGGSIQLASARDVRDPENLFELLCNGSVTFWDSAPAALQQLQPFMEHRTEEVEHSTLRLVFMSGDWVPVTLPGKLKDIFRGNRAEELRIVALGGATEATVWSNYFEVEETDPAWTSIPYGRPVQNAAYYVLNTGMQVQPAGIPGDLYIGGECLAEGYINDPGLTAGKFLPNPFGDGRIYKTGDMARWWRNGVMEFLGRKDQQVKVRGYRVELGEIEAQLRKHPLIKDLVVTDIADKSGNRQLAAYYESESMLTLAELSEYLSRKLPEYMIPSYFIKIDKIPVTMNGKVDKKALPSPRDSFGQGEEYTAPSTSVEEKIAGFWEEILGLRNIGIHHNFFDIGGNSMKVVELYRLIDQAFPSAVNVTSLFDNTSIYKQALFIENRLQLQERAMEEEIKEIEL